MSQEQPRREVEEEPRGEEDVTKQEEPIKYGTVFDVSGELAEKPIAPGDATMMQTAETAVLGHVLKGGAGAAMEAAANMNVEAGIVSPKQVTDIAGRKGVTVTESDVPGRRLITESVAGQVVGQYVQPATGQAAAGGDAPTSALLTFGEAIEAALQTSGDKPVDMSDAAAIQEVEFLLSGIKVMTPNGLAATAQSAAAHNQGIIGDESKVKLKDILTGASRKVVATDRPVRREDAEAVAQAEIRNSPSITTHPGGVAASLAAAVRLNEKGQSIM